MQTKEKGKSQHACCVSGTGASRSGGLSEEGCERLVARYGCERGGVRFVARDVGVDARQRRK